jgi:DNA polymerase III subunit alpha
MRILIVDTETNGLPASRWTKESDWKQWPEIVQISWEIWEVLEGEQPRIVKSEDHLLKQDPSIKWSSIAESFHKIPLDLCQKQGEEWKPVLMKFQEDLASCDGLAAHNLDFDRKIIRAGIWRTGAVPWNEGVVLELCTMRGAQGFYDFGPDRNGNPKAPTLKQLHDACIPGTYDCSGAGPWHTATHDLHCAALCFWVMCRDDRFRAILQKCAQITGRTMIAKDEDLLHSIKPYMSV